MVRSTLKHIQEQLYIGKQYLEKRQDAEAEQIFCIVVDIEPDNTEALQGLAASLAGLGKNAEAFEVCDKVLRLDPKLAKPHVTKSFLHLKQKNFDLAEQEVDTAIKLDPKYGMAHNNKGFILLNKQDYESAMTEFLTAIDLDKESAIPHYNLGLALEKLSRSRDALAEYHLSATLDPLYIEAHFGLARTYDKNQEHKWALSEYRRALELDPSRKDIKRALFFSRYHIPFIIGVTMSLICAGAFVAPLLISIPFFLAVLAAYSLLIMQGTKQNNPGSVSLGRLGMIFTVIGYVFIRFILWIWWY